MKTKITVNLFRPIILTCFIQVCMYLLRYYIFFMHQNNDTYIFSFKMTPSSPFFDNEKKERKIK